jgi:hypothetical protein
VVGLHQLPSGFGAGLTSLKRLSLHQLLLPRLAALPAACITHLELRGCTTLLDEGLSWPGSVVELSVTDVRPPEGHPTLQPFASLAQLPKLTRLVLDGTLLDAKAVPLYCLGQLSSLSMRSCGLVYTELGGVVQGSIGAMTQHPDPEQQGGVLRELVALNLSNKEYSVGQPTEQINRLRGVDLQVCVCGGGGGGGFWGVGMRGGWRRGQAGRKHSCSIWHAAICITTSPGPTGPARPAPPPPLFLTCGSSRPSSGPPPRLSPPRHTVSSLSLFLTPSCCLLPPRFLPPPPHRPTHIPPNRP